ncbi:DUF5703 family protein [Demequina sp. B12]|uniref:DUF5703 family protein n=1 Tax=Demequina sp. B12 TaxID=2992757 RepID=UPI00237A7998|nr:DUF5703 family protein [Demequina sp. B12]MDE0573210.1 DUF5703 family protein [Demequina sp. B12]
MTHEVRPQHRITPTRRGASRPKRYEWRVITIPMGMTRADARTMLTEHAEYGRWELTRSQILIGGSRRVWLRRRVIRPQRTDVA